MLENGMISFRFTKEFSVCSLFPINNGNIIGIFNRFIVIENPSENFVFFI